MSTDPSRTEFTVQDDPRLLAGVLAIVLFAGQRCGLSSEAQDGLAEAAVDACRETFPLANNNGNANPALKVIPENRCLRQDWILLLEQASVRKRD
jgi:hypothetical protein